MSVALGDMPIEIFDIIKLYLDDLSLVSLFRTCKGFQFTLQYERDKRARKGFLAPASDFTRHFTFPEGFNIGVDLPTRSIRRLYDSFPRNYWDDLPFEGYLVHTIKNRQIDSLRALLDLGASPDSYSTASKCLLWHAVATEDMWIIRLLLERGANVHNMIPTFDVSLLNPIENAMQVRNIEIVRLLYEDSAYVNSLASHIVGRGSIEFIRESLRKGMRLQNDDAVLDMLIYRGDREIFDFLLPFAVSTGALIKGDDEIMTVVNHPLHIAVKENQPKMVSDLIAAGINLNVKDWDGRTALHVALICDRLEIAREILNAGCKLNICDVFDCAELHTALQLRDHRLNFTFVTDSSENRLDTSEFNVVFSAERLSIIALLLEKGADVDIHRGVDSGAWHVRDAVETPLMYAVRLRNPDSVQLLLTHQPDLTIRNFLGQTALEVAESLGYSEIADMLR